MATENPKPQDQPNEKQPPADPPVTPIAQADKAPDNGKQSDAGQKSAGQKKKPKVPTWLQSWRNWQKGIAVANVILAGAIVYYACVQVDVTKQQNTEMSLQRDEMIKQSAASEGQLKQAVKASKLTAETIELAREQMRREQRAWLSTAHDSANTASLYFQR